MNDAGFTGIIQAQRKEDADVEYMDMLTHKEGSQQDSKGSKEAVATLNLP